MRERPPVGAIPKDRIWSAGKLELWRCRRGPARFSPPVLVIPTPSSPSYLLDLRPGNSMLEFLRDAGFDVFVLEWGEPDLDEASNSLETYVDDLLPRAVEAVRATGAAEVTIAAFCVGGVPALLYAAAHPEPVRNFVSLATPIDLAEVPHVATPIRGGHVDVDELLDERGNLPRDVMLDTFALHPTQQRLWNEFGQDFWAISQWFRERRALPGAAFQQAMELIVRENALAGGTVRLGGRDIELANLGCPVLNVIAEHDTNFPVAAVEPLRRVVGGDVDELRVPTGHLALVGGRLAMTRTFPPMADWIARHSEPARAVPVTGTP